MGLWLPIIVLCASPYIDSCKVITGNDLVVTKEQCFMVSAEKANKAVTFPHVFRALPLCQIIPDSVLPEEAKGEDI